MGKTVSNDVKVEQAGAFVRVTRTMIEDLTPEEYLQELSALVARVNHYESSLIHDKKMRDVWTDGRALAIKMRDANLEAMAKGKIPGEVPQMDGVKLHSLVTKKDKKKEENGGTENGKD